MAAFQQAAKRRRVSLSMMVMLLLHWSFSSCAALADTLCVEPDGVVVWEQSGDPCHSALVEHVSDTPCVDFQAQDGHDDHASVYSKLQLTDPPACHSAADAELAQSHHRFFACVKARFYWPAG